jgi:uncharacterized protein
MTSQRAFHGHGIDLKPEHSGRFLDETPPVDWVEVISERFLNVRGGAQAQVLERVRSNFPVTLHGVGLSLGSVDPLDGAYLKSLRALADRVEPVFVSDHLAWASMNGTEMDLMPLPHTEEALDHVVGRVQQVQDLLGRRLLLENPSSYVRLRGSTMAEWEFLAAVACRADCGILLDVNNVYVSSRNHGFAPLDYLDGLPADRVLQIHLAGHRDLGDVVVDTHEGPVPDCVWDLYAQAVARFGAVPTIVEWDTGVPPLEVMVAESARAAALEARVLA